MSKSIILFLTSVLLASHYGIAQESQPRVREHPILLVNPSGGEMYVPGQQQVVILGPKTLAKSLRVELSRDGGQTFETVGSIDNRVKERSLRNRLNWTTSLPESDTCILRVESTDPRKPGTATSKPFSIGRPNLDTSTPDSRYILRAGDTMTGPLTLSGNPTQNLDAATKQYVDTGDSRSVRKSGDTMTGPLTLNSDPTQNLEAATKQYVDSRSAAIVPSGYSILGDSSASPAGYTFTGAIMEGLDSWTSKASLPTARGYVAAGVVKGKIYVIAGTDGDPGTPLNVVEEYDPATNTWATKTPIPTARRLAVIGVVNDKVYVIGGFNGGHLNTVEEYDPATNSWSTKSPMPTARENAAAAVVNGKIYVIGGGDGADLKTVEEYDPVADSWATKAPLTTARYAMGSAVVNGKIYVVGGWMSSSIVAINEEYDPGANTWTTKASMPTVRSGPVAGVIKGMVYVIGGGSPGIGNKVEQYNPMTNTWSVKKPMPTARKYPAGGVINETIYVFGGLNPGISATSEAYSCPIFYVHRKN